MREGSDVEGFGMARAAVSAILMNEAEAFESIINEASDDDLKQCCAVLAGLAAGQVTMRAVEQNSDPMVFWGEVIKKSISSLGF